MTNFRYLGDSLYYPKSAHLDTVHELRIYKSLYTSYTLKLFVTKHDKAHFPFSVNILNGKLNVSLRY